jgi:nicotinate phosphoribosyltransferase
MTVRGIATPEEVKQGLVSDVYFLRAHEVIAAEGADSRVTAEFSAGHLPSGYAWGIVTGIPDCLAILQDKPVDAWAMPEGTVLAAGEPVLTITADYLTFGALETALLGLLCHSSGVATRAARCKLAADGRTVLSFGARRVHPCVAPMVEYNAFLGGCDGVAMVRSARELGIEPMGTMPHALVILLGDVVRAALAFDRHVDQAVPRIALVDTFEDEKRESLRVAEALGDRLAGVRLDTPSSRRGDMVEILREVRWELDLRGFHAVRLFLSGGLDEGTIPPYNPYVVGYGVGTAISNAPVVDFAMDIVEVDELPTAKRGKRSGKKQVWLCPSCGSRTLRPWNAPQSRCPCGAATQGLLQQVMRSGAPVLDEIPPDGIRHHVLEQLSGPAGRWLDRAAAHC